MPILTSTQNLKLTECQWSVCFTLSQIIPNRPCIILVQIIQFHLSVLSFSSSLTTEIIVTVESSELWDSNTTIGKVACWYEPDEDSRLIPCLTQFILLLIRCKSKRPTRDNKTLHPTADQLQGPISMTVSTSHKSLSSLSGHQSVCFTLYWIGQSFVVFLVQIVLVDYSLYLSAFWFPNVRELQHLKSQVDLWNCTRS